MNTNNKILKWFKKGENWIPLSVFGGVSVIVILSWITIFFVEYGPYFSEEYQTSLFNRAERKEGVPLLETEYIYIDGKLTWSVSSSFNFKFGDYVTNYSEITGENGNGQRLEIDYNNQLLRVSEIVGQQRTEIRTEEAPSAKSFMKMAFNLDLPVDDMSFKPKMENISLFKKDNALVSCASMPSGRSFTLNVWGQEKTMKISDVSLSCQTLPWAEEGDHYYQTSFRYQIRGSFEGKAIEIKRWLCWSYL